MSMKEGLRLLFKPKGGNKMVVRCIHDVYLNWVDGGSRSHEIPHYHEWKEDDTVELYDSLPVVKVEPELYTALEDGYEEIPKELLEFVHKVARKVNPQTHRKNQVEYCFAATDGKRVIVINTEGDTKPNLKSRLVIRHEQFVIQDLAPDMEVMTFDFTPEVYETDESLEAYLLAADPKDYQGLTRTEKEMKQIVLDCLYNVSLCENRAEVYYWFTELFPELYSPELAAEMPVDGMIAGMFNHLRKGWSERHVEWGTQVVKGKINDIYKDEWTSLLKQSKEKDKVEK